MKNLCIVDRFKKILFVSETYFGKTHDKTIFLNEKINKFLPGEIKKLFDTAFEGLEKDCPFMENIIKPTKKKRGQKAFSKSVIERNRRISKRRVKVENAFAGVKRLKITWDIFRNIKPQFGDKIFSIACGIWNFHLIRKV